MMLNSWLEYLMILSYENIEIDSGYKINRFVENNKHLKK